MDESGDSTIIKLSGRNATTYDEDTEVTLVKGYSSGYRRGYKTVKGTNWKGAAYVMSIDTSKQEGNGGVLGLVFDEYDNNGGNMYVLGLRYRETKTQIYLSYFEGVTDEQLNGAASSDTFGTAEYQLINGGSSSSYCTLSGVTPDTDKKVTITVIVYQNSDDSGNYTGKYGIAIYAGDKSTEFANLNVENISLKKDSATLPDGAISLSMATVASNKGKLFTTYSTADDVTSTKNDTLSSFGVMKNSKGTALDGKTAAEGKFGFYANIYSNGSLDGAWTSLDVDLADEVVEE